MKCYAAPSTFISGSTPACYKDRSSIDVLISTYLFYFFFLAFLILSSFFWGTTSFQLTKKANDINGLLMSTLVTKSLHKNSSVFETNQYFSGDKTKLASSLPRCNGIETEYTRTPFCCGFLKHYKAKSLACLCVDQRERKRLVPSWKQVKMPFLTR